MTPEEIVRDYQQAKNKQKQIRILADLNNTSPGEIKAILAAAGVDGVEAPKRSPPKDKQTGQVCGLPEIYLQIETILTALPPNASEYARKSAMELAIALFREYIGPRLSCGTTNVTVSQTETQK